MSQRTKNPPSTVDPAELGPLRTAEEISPLVGYAPSTILRKVREGEFPCQRFGRKGGIGEIRFSDEDVAKIRAMAVTPQQANSEIRPKDARA